MAGRIPQQFIDDLVSRVDIVEIIDSYVPLRKAGRNHVACCPFHDEKTPSFTVSQSKQFYHCFGCGAHGTVIGFLMDYGHMDFIEAVNELASRTGMEVPQDAKSQHSDTSKPLYEVLQEVAIFYQHQLKENPQGKFAIDYLKGRGLIGQTAMEFGIGYSPPGWDTLLQKFGDTTSLQQQLSSAGMLIKKDGGGYYDRFRNRIMFPIRDARGRVIGFGGRALGDDTPKYLNSPETPVFHKGRELYGLFEARKSQRELERLLVVEGYMDVVMLAQNGIGYSVATLGTATTTDHLERMYRVAPHVIFCFDGDRAGREAAERALETLLPIMREGRQASFMFLPEGEDPDSLIQQIGRQQFEQKIVNAIPFSSFFYELLLKKVDISSIDGRARLIELTRPRLSKIQQGVYKHMMTVRLAEITGMDTQTLLGLLEGPSAQITAKKPGIERRSEQLTPSLVRKSISLLVQNTSLANIAGDPQRFSGLNSPGIKLLIELLELLQHQPHLSTGALLEHWREREESRYLAKLAQQEFLIEGKDLEQEFLDALSCLFQQYVDQRVEDLCKISPGKLSAQEKIELQQLLISKTVT